MNIVLYYHSKSINNKYMGMRKKANALQKIAREKAKITRDKKKQKRLAKAKTTK